MSLMDRFHKWLEKNKVDENLSQGEKLKLFAEEKQKYFGRIISREQKIDIDEERSHVPKLRRKRKSKNKISRTSRKANR